MIQMIAGVYGMRVEKPNGGIKIVGMGPESGSFSIPPEQEARLVAEGLAEYVADANVGDIEPERDMTEPVDAPIGFDETPPEDVTEDEPEELVEDEEDEMPLEDMTAKELRDFAKSYGLTFPGNAKKTDMIAAIREKQDEPAPTFDAAEAVQ